MNYGQVKHVGSFLVRTLRSAAYAAKPQNVRQRLRVAPWFHVNGDKTLRLEYDLGRDSLVFDVGGYEGNWASDIFSMYQCGVYIFEPVPEYFSFISRRFRQNPDIQAFPFGLAASSQDQAISVSGDSSSIFSSRQPKGRMIGERQNIQLKSFSDFIIENKIEQIDLLKINIEGGEYDLLDSILAEGLQHSIRNIQVQFHCFIPNAPQRMRAIQKQLTSTHQLTYQFPFVWENWQLKDAAPENPQGK